MSLLVAKRRGQLEILLFCRFELHAGRLVYLALHLLNLLRHHYVGDMHS